MTEDSEYDLKQSLKEIGVLYPVLADAEGRIIDGKHRLAVDPKWPVFVLPDINTDEKHLVARIIANTHRRTVSAEEKQQWLGELAEKTGWTPQQIAEKLGMSYQWIMKYLPNNYKEKTWDRQPILQRRIERTEVPPAVEEPLKEAETALQPSQNLEAAASTSEPSEKVGFEPTPAAEPELAKEQKPKTFKCRACQEEYAEPIKPIHVILCPECEMQFQIWLADRDL